MEKKEVIDKKAFLGELGIRVEGKIPDGERKVYHDVAKIADKHTIVVDVPSKAPVSVT